MAVISNYGIDHYTLIVPNAKKVSDFHQCVLDYKFINKILVNTGVVPQGKHDMLNYVLSWSFQRKGVMVVTEGLTENSIFTKFMKKYGQGIHHIAFEVDNIYEVFEHLKQHDIELTSDHLLHDPISGLKQFFISNIYLGIFIELIERKSLTESIPKASQLGFFKEENMSGLAQTMSQYLDQEDTEDNLIKNEDTTSYFRPLESIKVQKIEGLVLYPHDSTKARGFLKSVFGFEEKSDYLFDPKNPNFRFYISDYNTFKEKGIIPAKLLLQVSDISQSKQVLDTHNLTYKESDDYIHLDPSYSGYPIYISASL